MKPCAVIRWAISYRKLNRTKGVRGRYTRRSEDFSANREPDKGAEPGRYNGSARISR